jgi:serine/threonine-protein kinase
MSSGHRVLPERALEIVDGVLEALAYSHGQGIVHRDIKPANVMLTRSGEVKVMDFGIARAVADIGQTMTQTSAVIGTPQYISPEQARGEQADARSDLYSTGCVLYELLTGRPPFDGDSAYSVVHRHLGEDALPPSRLDPDVPTAVDAITLKALAKDRDERYQSANEMRRDISAVQAGRPVAAVVPPPQHTQQFQPTTVLPGGVGTGMGPRVPPRERRGGRAFGYTLLAIAVLAIFVIAALLARSVFDGSGASQVSVPNVIGLTVPKAKQSLKAEGLKLGTQTPKHSATVPKGNIIDQSPEDGTQVNEGRAVNVDVSTGVEETTVPSLVGLSLDEATQALTRAKLELGSTDQVASDEDRNTVTKVRPKEGETVPVGSKVDLTYASGSNKVPDVVGDDEGTARNRLEQAGFQVDKREQQTADQPPGTVVSQSPSGGETTRLNSTVTIVVATAPPSPTPTPTPTDTTASPSVSVPGT